MRSIIRLDIKNEYVVKGRQFEGYRKIIPLSEIIKCYSNKKVEIFLYDLVATLFGFNSIIKQLPSLLSQSFLPVTVGGGIDSLDKVNECFSFGVDRLAVNTCNFRNPAITKYITQNYGQQASIAHVEAKKIDGKWCAMYETGRELGNACLSDHVKYVQDLGVGEIILSSIENDGMLNGFPKELLDLVSGFVSVPLIISGGIKNFDDKDLYADYRFVKGISISRAELERVV
mgnify:CR=1 FL=1